MGGMSTPPPMNGQGNAQQLREYWTTGPGGVAIGWGTPGDFGRCTTRLSRHMTPEQAKGFCAERHHDALGIWPAEHKP